MSSHRPASTLAAAAISAAAIALLAGHAAADLTLTPDGVARNFQLSTFVSGYPSSGGVGPVGLDYQLDGTVLVTSLADNAIRRFTNVDGHTLADGTLLNYPNSEFPHDVAHIGSTLYVSRFSSQSIVELNPDGSINRTVVSGIGNARAMEVNPTNGHILVSCVQGIRDVDPVAGTFTTLNNVEVDGITISPDGSVLYGSVLSNGPGGHIVGYNTVTGLPVFDSGFIGSGGADGAALGFGQFEGNIYCNTTSGQVWEINLLTHAQTLIASGGSRGDFVASDPFGTGDLLLTQTDRVIRLRGIPTPSACGLLVLAGAAATRRRRTR